MNEALESIMEEREDLMVSPAGDSEPTFRTAHFLKPIANSIDGQVSEFSQPKEWPLSFHLNGWRSSSSNKWIGWVKALYPKYESLWRKVGIFDAIMSSRYTIVKNQDLLGGVSEKWCSKTNTFLFPWGEATITLEDVMVLGGFPVVGDPVFTPLESKEMRVVEQQLIKARQEPWRTRRCKALKSSWMDIFINSGSEIEHEAFLTAWLSMYVFPYKGMINKAVFPIAIHLARGNTIALAPAVLASVYKDLGCLRETIAYFAKNPPVAEVDLEVTLQSPFYLVQTWVWERFKNLQPDPNLINNGDPILARWHKVKALPIDNVRLALNLAFDDFRWRPYVRYAGSGKWKGFYPENEIWVLDFDADLDKEQLSLVTCLRVSELVGIDSIIKQYLPHRVAMQFGMDQDVPGCVPRFNQTKAIAWENYCRPICDGNLYCPSRHFEADVTTAYARWWKQSVFDHPVKNIVRRKRSERRSSNRGTHASKANRSGNDADVPPGFPPKHVSNVISGKCCDDDSTTREGDDDSNVPSSSLRKCLKAVTSRNFVISAKYNTLNHCNSFENCKPVLEENQCGGMTHSLVNETAYECEHLSNEGSSAYTSVHAAIKDDTEALMWGLGEDFEDANGSIESRLSCDRGSLSGTRGEGYNDAPETNVEELDQRIDKLKTECEQRIEKLQRVTEKLMKARSGQSWNFSL